MHNSGFKKENWIIEKIDYKHDYPEFKTKMNLSKKKNALNWI